MMGMTRGALSPLGWPDTGVEFSLNILNVMFANSTALIIFNSYKSQSKHPPAQDDLGALSPLDWADTGAEPRDLSTFP